MKISIVRLLINKGNTLICYLLFMWHIYAIANNYRYQHITIGRQGQEIKPTKYVGWILEYTRSGKLYAT